MSVLALSGWGQAHDALRVIAPDALHLDYVRYGSVPEVLSEMERTARDAELVIGWSLGGQLAVRAIAERRIAPRHLVLIASPFQFVASEQKPLGMKRDLHEKFRGNFVSNPERTLAKAWELIVKDDAQEPRVRIYMDRQNRQQLLQQDWLAWLDILEGFSCDGLDMGHFPPTLLLHGDKDVVIDPGQSRYFASLLPQARLVEMPGCGHAPHWHAPEAVMQMIQEHIDV